MGLNFSWNADAEQPQEGFEHMSQLFSSARGRIDSAFPDGQTKIGSILYNEAHGYRLRLRIDPQLKTDGNLSLNFNYHFDVSSHSEARGALSRLASCLSNAERSGRNLLSMAK